jgi:hypothetical protein
MLKRFKTVPSIGTLIALSHGRRKGSRQAATELRVATRRPFNSTPPPA